MSKDHHRIDFVEFPAKATEPVKAFYSAAFGWEFTDYGPTYTCPTNAGLDAGFQADPDEAPARPLITLYSNDLEASLKAVEAAGATIRVPIFSFPGGRRFHFCDPAGNELAVWSDL